MPGGGPEVDVGVAIPIGSPVPLGVAIAVLVGAGVVVGSHLQATSSTEQVVVRVIDDGAVGGPAVVSTQVLPLR